MRLAKLTLNGFKSFDDRTEFHFDDPVTGIVGPNGCGKSNVVDALKWVLGERSSKSLRGKEMLDVIFAGSAARKPAGMASVTLTFENPPLDEAPKVQDPEAEPLEINATLDGAEDESSDIDDEPDANSVLADRRTVGRGLPVDTDIVEVERRLYRDGGSQYLINNKRCRLRDIRDLFLDTGVGADAYSIIEQGRVDAMLLANPQERRTIFEEAAGIARYRQRRVESIRKLDRAERNLAVTREQLANTERRLKIVRGQAAKARQFVELDAELRAWRASRALAQHDALTTAVERIHEDMEGARAQRDKAEAELGALEKERQEADLKRHDAARALRTAEAELAEANASVERAKHKRELAERSASEALSRLDADGQRLAEVEQAAEEAEAQAEKAAERVAAVAEQLADAERVLEQASQARQQAQQDVAKHRQAHGEKRREVERIERDQLSAKARIEEETRRADQLAEKARLVEAELAGLDEEAERASGQREAALGEAQKFGDAHAQRTSEAERLETEASSLGEGRAKQSQEVKSLEERRLRLETRHHAVEEVLASREGLGQPAREVLDRVARGEGFGTVIAPLAELIRVPIEHAPQVEAALGSLLAALVVPSMDAMPSREDLATLTGRVSFVPLGIGVPAVEERYDHAAFAALRAAGRLLPLREVAGVDEVACRAAGVDPTSVSGLLDVLLHDCWRTGDLEAAALLSAGPMRGPMRGATIADGNASVLRYPGVVSAGPLTAEAGEGGQAMGVLQRRAELEQLTVDLERATGELERAQAALRTLDEKAGDLAERQTAVQRTLNELVQSRLKAEGEAERAGDAFARLDRQRNRARDEQDAAAKSGTQAREKVEELEGKLASLSGILDDERTALDGLGAVAEQAEKDADSLGEALTVARVSASRLGEQIGAVRREASGLRDAAAKHRASQRDLAAHVQRASEQAQAHQKTAREAAEEIESLQEEAEAVREGLDGKRAALHGAQEAALGLERKFDAARRSAGDVDKAWHDLELRGREADIRLENLVQRTMDEDGLDLPAELPGYREALGSGSDGDEYGVMRAMGDQESSEAISTLKKSIDKLGSVNLAAMDEEGQLAGKNEQLAAQVEDIDNARIRLETLIDQLNEASRHRFGDMLERVRESFAGDDGLFRQLFGGGRAEIKLMPLVREVDGQKVVTDEVDLLESGIEIVARPPGKQPRSISQLSGGEKAMTAVALLLAIFQSKPSCFCVLDEVDAALDDANVDRFSRVVKQFSVKSNFIVITHHKKTMAMCDRMHGVTMQERGVSTRVGVRFDQVGADGRLSAAAVDSSAKAPDANGVEKPKLRDALAHMKRGEAAEVEAGETAELAEAN
ncbi:MAG: chromosome segregation protein SMC [Phycisphaera sp.]|nr:MAG: chromosome segregation protein SMC [Phycisphaera sp.]